MIEQALAAFLLVTGLAGMMIWFFFLRERLATGQFEKKG